MRSHNRGSFFLILVLLTIFSEYSYSQIVISQIYGGGGNSGATYKNDFIELFNQGTAAVSVTGWTVQYASASGTTWYSTPLSGSIPTGGYYLVQEAQGAGGTVDLSTPNAIGGIAISASSGKIALVNSSAVLSGSCPSSSTIVDLVGYGVANCSEGIGAPALTNTTSLLRSNAGCSDTDNNASNFQTGFPAPRNSSSALNPCGGSTTNPGATAIAQPKTASPGSAVLFMVSVTPGSNPTSTGIGVRCDLSSIGGSNAQTLFDDATNGDVIAGDNTFVFRTTISPNTQSGSKGIPVTVTDAQSRTATVNILLDIETNAFENGLVFPQVATGGGWKTSFLLTNSAASAATATIEFYSGTGGPMPVVFNGVEDNSFLISVPAYGSTSLVASPLSESAQTTAGWAKITSSGSDLNGNAVFQLFNGSELVSEASVPAVHPASSVDFYVEEGGEFSTGIALANPTTLKGEGVLTLRDKQGVVYDTIPITLAPLGYDAAFLFQKTDVATSGRAQLSMTKGYVSALALRMSSSGLISTISVNQPGYSVAGATALFSPQGGVTQRIISEINSAQASIDIAIYSFTSDGIRDALVNAKNRGVAIRIIADTSQAGGSGSEVSYLEQTGFAIKRSAGGSGGIMHNKYMIIDGVKLFTGSFNWSANAEDNNFENAIFIQASPVIQTYIDDFNQIWAR